MLVVQGWEAHGQVVESGATFRVGEALPGDPLRPVNEIANCRCVALPVVDDLVIDLAHRCRARTEAEAPTRSR